MNKYLLYMFLVLCTIQQFHSQESNGVVALALPVRNSLKFNRYAISPTLSFVREQNKYISFTNKKQWAQFEDAPQSYLFSYSGRFAENIGAGVGLFQQDFGVFTTFGGMLNFAYNANFSRENNLTFGLNIGAYQSSLNQGRVVVNTPDPSLQNVPSNFLITINPGINYGTGFLDFGLSINNLVAYNLTNSKIIEDNPEQAFQAHAMYTGYMNTRGFFDESRFSALIRSEFKKEQTIISGIAMLNVPKGIWAQAGYNTLYGASAGIGVNVTNNIAIEYNYEQSMGNFSEFGSSHEITLAYRFKKNYRYNYGDEDEEQSVFNIKKRRAKPNNLTDGDRARIAQRRAEIAARRKADAEAKKAQAEEVDSPKQNKDGSDAVSTQKEKVDVAKKEEENRLRLEAEAEAKQKQQQDEANKAKEQARVKAENEARKKQELEQQKQREESARQKAEEERRIKLEAEKKAQVAQEKAEAEAAKRKAEEAERLKLEEERKKLEEQAKLKAQEAAREKLEAERKNAEALALAKAEAEKEARLKFEAQQKAEEERKRAEAEENARLEQERLKAEAEAKEAAEAKAEEEARLKAEAEAERIKLEEEAKAKLEAKNEDIVKEAPIADDEASKTMQALVNETKSAKKAQNELINALSEKIDVKQKDLDDLKEENDLSEQGIYLAPKPFKSLSKENAAIAALKDQLERIEKEQEVKMIELEAILIKRKRKFKKDAKGINDFYLNALEGLKADQLRVKNTKESLVSNLERINEATDFERKRRIRRAAYDNQEDRYNKDKAALARIKKFTDQSPVPLQEEDFDFGEEQTKNIQIIKNVLNEEPGYYMVIAVHNNVAKRDEFVSKVVASGEKNVNFFFDVKTNKYFIYYEKYDTIGQAKNALDKKGSKPYNGKMSLVKIDN